METTSENHIDISWEKNRRYGVIIDAGSSGSRIYIYSWKDHEHIKSTIDINDLKGKMPIVERGDQHGLKWTRREEPGISTYGSKPTEIKDHLGSLLSFAAEVVPEDMHPSTPIFVMATAGMRLLPESEQEAVLGATCGFIRDSSSFFMSDCDSHIQIIPGELEGVYGWMAVNYLMGGFDASFQDPLIKPAKKEQHHTFGFLDMGGASAQIAFEPEHHQKEEHMDDLTQIFLRTLDGTEMEYDVFVTTFLGYGSNEARRRYLEERVKSAYEAADGKNLLDEHHALHIDDPCLPLNLNVSDSHSTSVSLSLHGTGSFDKCMEYTMPLLNKDAACPTKPCLFNGVHTPHIDWSVNKFVGISEYWYSSHDILGLGGVYDFVEYEKKATDYCAKDWSDFTDEHKEIDALEMHRYELQCFKSAWIVNVLHDGIEIPRIVDPGGHGPGTDKALLEQSIESVSAKNWNPPFQSIDTINDIQVSWTLGAMLLHVANQIPLSDSPNKLQGHNTDDEGAHEIADGVKMPKPRPLPQDNITYDSISRKQPTIMDNVMNNVSPFGWVAILLMVLCAVFILYLFKNVRRKKRFDMEYRRPDTSGPNGGLLGTSTPPQSWSPLSYLQAIENRITQSLLSLRFWASRVIRFRSSYTSGIPLAETEALPDMPPNGESVSINMLPLQPSGGRATLGPSTMSPSTMSSRYWNKKRYSGDSHNLNALINGQQVEGSSVLPFRTPSVLGLANRNGSSPNLVRNGSSTNLTAFPASPEPLANGGPNRSPLQNDTSLGSSRSRVGFVIHEQSDEDECTSDGQVDATVQVVNTSSPSVTASSWLSNSSPRASPRGSLDERRAGWTTVKHEMD
ncbi:nucleoside phosphatase family-domain-containing protein [Phycomyces nitens]|nr:nucleoside phosphatase family-domain-containing protein [Phycomyces nitens]